GQPAYLTSPNGAYAPDPAAGWHLFAGDEAAVPAIGAALEALPDNAIGQVFIEVAGPEDEITLSAPAGVEVRWIYRGGRADLVPEDMAGDHAPLIAAVKEADWLPGQVQVFIHGEAQAVMHNLRPYIRKERGVDAKWAASISGYWRRGRTEETFRQWKRELAEAESTACGPVVRHSWPARPRWCDRGFPADRTSGRPWVARSRRNTVPRRVCRRRSRPGCRWRRSAARATSTRRPHVRPPRGKRWSWPGWWRHRLRPTRPRSRRPAAAPRAASLSHCPRCCRTPSLCRSS